ncbi:MAG: immunoglobulin domain-containing protein [Verrucomicrobiales bacterium]|nr:immunoglobulin domain-containing protein [Verrucomicrobiales bacterium]
MSGPGSLSFYYATTSSQGLFFLLDSQIIGLGASPQWDEMVITIPPGVHTALWRLGPWQTRSNAWVDQVRFSPAGSAPSFTGHANTNKIILGSSLTLRAFAKGTPPLSYLWLRNGLPITGAENSALTINNLHTSDLGAYSVVISNSFGTTSAFVSSVEGHDNTLGAVLDSDNITWTTSGWIPWTVVGEPVVIGSNSLAIGWSGEFPVSAGRWSDPLRLSTVLTGPGTLQFWWRMEMPVNSLISYLPSMNMTLVDSDGNEVARRSLSNKVPHPGGAWIHESAFVPAGTYALSWDYNPSERDGPGFFENFGPKAWLDGVKFSPGATLPFISQQPSPSDLTVLPNVDVSWAVTADGTPPLSYQWRSNGTNITDAIGTSFAINAVQPHQQGILDVIVWNAFGSVTSAPIHLGVLPRPTNPQVRVIEMPPFGQGGVVSGVVSNVTFTNYAIAAYLKVGFNGWWTKPSFAAPLTQLNPASGTFSFSAVTGGIDALASQYAVFLIPLGWSPPALSGSQVLPDSLFTHAESYSIVTRDTTTQPTITVSQPNPSTRRIEISSGQIWMYYAVEATDSLTNPNWITLTESTKLYVTSYSYDDIAPSPTDSRFYRVVYIP